MDLVSIKRGRYRKQDGPVRKPLTSLLPDDMYFMTAEQADARCSCRYLVGLGDPRTSNKLASGTRTSNLSGVGFLFFQVNQGHQKPALLRQCLR